MAITQPVPFSNLPPFAPGMAPTMPLPAGVSQEQVQAAFQQMQQMFQQAVQSGAMPTMVPGGQV